MKLKNRVLSSFSAVTAVCLGINATADAQDAPASSLKNSLADQLQYVLEAQDRYIIKFRPDQGLVDVGEGRLAGSTGAAAPEQRFESSAAVQAVNRVAGQIHKVMEKRSVVIASLDAEARSQLSLRPDVESISPDPVRMPLSQTVPVSYEMIQATQLAQPDTSAIKVCVIDTGIDDGHEDLPDQNNGLTGSATGPAVGDWYHDGYGHGTHVAGTVAAYDNTYGSVGVYPGVSLHVVKVFDDNGGWTYASNIVEAIDQCAEAGAKVVNMSLGGPGSSNYENQALTEFEEQGILMVAAAGNDGNANKAYPASYDSVVSVAAVGTTGNRAGYSQYNDQVELAAPGKRIYSTYPGNSYRKLTGTSMASPHVAGAAALVWSFFPECSNREVRDVLASTAQDRGEPGRDDYYGYGLIQASDAYDAINTYGCSGTGEDEPDPVTEPETVEYTGLSASTNGWSRFALNVPQGTSTFTVEITGGTGNADLYVKQGSKPKYRSYDCRPYEAHNSEICTFEAPAAGEWHIGVRARTAYEEVTLRYTLGSGQQPAPDPDPDPGTDPVEVVESDLAAGTYGWSRFSATIPDGMSTLRVEIAGGTGNADLYVKAGSIPKYRSYDCRPYEDDNTEVCVFDAPASGEWHIGVRARTAYTDVTMTYTYQ